ncbi:MAG: DUF2177 family protein [Asticcacaulis sp.]
MIKSLFAYASTLLTFVVVDFVWLGLMSPVFYRPAMGDLLASQFRLLPAVAFYLLYGFGLWFFGVRPALDSGQWYSALLFGVLLGLFAYGTYDLTNMATLKQWPLKLALVDMAWGAVLSGIACTAGFWLTRMLFKG